MSDAEGYRCSECGLVQVGEPALRMPFDQAVAQITRDETAEGKIIDVLAESDMRLESETGLYELCADCLADSELPRKA